MSAGLTVLELVDDEISPLSPLPPVTILSANAATGPQGPPGSPGVHVGPTPPADTSLLWVDTS